MRIGQRTTLRAALFKGVRDISNPYGVPVNMLAQMKNRYLPEPKDGASPRARPGFQLKNGTAQIGVDAGKYGQGMGVGTDASGNTYNFVVAGGALYRLSADLTTYTNVTPSGVMIDPKARVFVTPFSNRIVVNDGVHSPWVGDSLSSTPITKTVIDYTGDGVAWVAYGPPAVYDDALVFLVRQRSNPAVYRTLRIGWSYTDDPLTGYEQTNYDYEWDVVQNGTDPIYALYGDNLQLTYFRDRSIGYLSGTIGVNFQTSSAHDAIADGVGTRTPASLVAFGENSLFFVDELGRPQWLAGGRVIPIWEDMERVVTNAPTGWVETTAKVACAALVPQINAYVVAIWSPDATQTNLQYPTVLYAFDAKTGTYLGEWTIFGGIAIHSIGTLIGEDGEPVLVVLGSSVAAPAIQEPGDGGYVWAMSRLEDGVWTDSDYIPDRSVTLPPNGYAEDTNLTVDRVVAVVQELQTNPYPVQITLDPTSLVLVAGAPMGTVTAQVRNSKGGFVTHANALVWASSNTAVATVAAGTGDSATVTYVGAGTANITCSLLRDDGTTLTSGPCAVTCSVVTSASGGTITQNGIYRVHTFTTNGTFTINNNGDGTYPAGSAPISVTVVGGGAGGANQADGGGGGGGGVYVGTITPAVGSTSITIGAGGATGANGSSSSFGATTAGGGSTGTTVNGGASGSPSVHTAGTGVAKAQAGVGSVSCAGGGAGAGAAGQNGVIFGGDGIAGQAGAGGTGLNGYAGGGAGGFTQSGTGSATGNTATDGGGATGQPGTPNTGGGGSAQQAGGSGVVIIQYLHP